MVRELPNGVHATSREGNDRMKTDHISVGIIGMGDMGKMYARRISDAGWR